MMTIKWTNNYRGKVCHKNLGDEVFWDLHIFVTMNLKTLEVHLKYCSVENHKSVPGSPS
jgi:hypothetical protein